MIKMEDERQATSIVQEKKVRIWADEIYRYADKEIELCGALHNLRDLKRLTFLILRDPSGVAQIIVEDEAERDALRHLHPETALRVTGIVRLSPQAPGGVEVHCLKIAVASLATQLSPLQLHKPSLDVNLATFLDNAPVGLRHPFQRAMLRLGSLSVAGFRDALNRERFCEIFSPKLVASATEGGANVFPVSYFGRTAYLAQSPQFYKQLAVGIFERVYETGPVFRAEPHDSARHLNQYTSLDVEFGYIQDHTDVMRMATYVLGEMVTYIQQHGSETLRALGIELPIIPDTIPSIDFSDAQQMIFERSGEDSRGEMDLSPSDERFLGEWAKQEHNSDFIFVTGYPMGKRPFYTHPNPSRPDFSNSFDLLFRGLELITGGQRLHRHSDYEEALRRRGLTPEAFTDYIEAFKYGIPPHGGFAIGLERWIVQIANRPNVREATLFPRDLTRLTP